MSPLTSWDRMWELFQGALEVPGRTREAWLREQSAGDVALRAKVGGLLAAHGRADRFLERGSGCALPTPAGDDRWPVESGSVFDGRYRIGEKIGEGGFSEVYLARQVEPVRRDVAIKVLRARVDGSVRAWDSGRALERFEGERQTLAALHHPAIATIFDAGVSPDGRPFFVMEHIAVAPITGYCKGKGLGLRQRLELFIETCAAVQYAHHKGVIHRDPKPANVLVTEVDGVPRVKVIDFGIATLVEDASSPEGGATGRRWHGGTPGYMSPEQAQAGDIDTRADVFSLGVVLYELLTGEVPFEVPGHGMSEVVERSRVRDAPDPPPPSARVTSPASHRLRGEPDWIVIKALSRDRADRYSSAAELAADLTRYLDRRPVLAGPATARYHASRFLVRHRFGAAVALAAIGVLITGIILLAVKARTESRLRAQAVQAQELAVREARMSEQTAIFLRQEVITAAAARPEAAGAMLEILQMAESQIDERAAGDPVAEAAIRRNMSDVYAMLKQSDRAIANAERAVELLRANLGSDDRHTFQAINNLGIAYRQAGRPADAAPLVEQSR
ncbi:MAG: serine/threonine-protein kinase [Phycisphaerales bacterium]